jgi:hypothetical protein
MPIGVSNTITMGGFKPPFLVIVLRNANMLPQSTVPVEYGVLKRRIKNSFHYAFVIVVSSVVTNI